MWLSGWQYRKKITIQGSSGAGINYQVFLKVGESSGSTGANFHLEGHSANFPSGKNQSGDIRFTASDGVTLLSFWVENVVGTAPNRVAYIWVKVADNLDTSKDVYIYYGNPNSTNASNGDNTFLFFDDFPGTTIDTTKWNIVYSEGWSVSGSDLIGTSSSGRITTNSTFSGTVAVETKTYCAYLNQNGYHILGFYINSSSCFGFLHHLENNRDYYINNGSWTSFGSTSPTNTNLLTKIIVKDNNLVDLMVLNYDNLSVIKSQSNISHTLGSKPISLGRRYDEAFLGQTYNNHWDWIIVRKYISPEPSFYSSGAEEVSINTAVIRRRLLIR
ncbi:MAG: DUF2341 domain-containing protein [Candidatus Aenigmatarchaeota archaeon]